MHRYTKSSQVYTPCCLATEDILYCLLAFYLAPTNKLKDAYEAHWYERGTEK